MLLTVVAAAQQLYMFQLMLRVQNPGAALLWEHFCSPAHQQVLAAVVALVLLAVAAAQVAAAAAAAVAIQLAAAASAAAAMNAVLLLVSHLSATL